jgi:hypothetical protein
MLEQACGVAVESATVVTKASVWPLAARERNGGGAEECAEQSRSGTTRANGQTEAPRLSTPVEP